MQTRAYDPRSGLISESYADYASPISEPVMKRFIIRHRLDRSRIPSFPYYLDPGVAGTRSVPRCSRARAGGRGPSKPPGLATPSASKCSPADADPMDIRYNLIEWVHRSTRGWSYGDAVTDPRTGEIIKGQVSLGSLRVRQDFLIAEGLIAKYEQGQPVDPRMEQMALARVFAN